MWSDYTKSQSETNGYANLVIPRDWKVSEFSHQNGYEFPYTFILQFKHELYLEIDNQNDQRNVEELHYGDFDKSRESQTSLSLHSLEGRHCYEDLTGYYIDKCDNSRWTIRDCHLVGICEHGILTKFLFLTTIQCKYLIPSCNRIREK